MSIDNVLYYCGPGFEVVDDPDVFPEGVTAITPTKRMKIGENEMLFSVWVPYLHKGTSIVCVYIYTVDEEDVYVTHDLFDHYVTGSEIWECVKKQTDIFKADIAALDFTF
jgi:hypothetical protein